MIQYIIKALLKQPSVFVNDLGTFTIQYQSAQLQKESITPPRNFVIFDNTTDHDEIAFTNLVCQERQCMLTQGNQTICQWVEELKTALIHNKSIHYEDFGTFSLQNNGSITFVSDFIPSLNTEFEGMGEVEIGRVESEEWRVESEEVEEQGEMIASVVDEPVAEEPETISTIVEEPVSESVSEPEETKDDESIAIDGDDDNDDDDDGDGDDDDDNEKDGKKRNLWWLYVLIILIAIGALGLVFKDKLVPVYQQVKDKITHKTEQVDRIDTDDTTETDIDATETEEEPVIEENVPYEPKTLKMTADSKYPYIQFEIGHYYAIAGSFPTEGDALRHIRQTGLDQYSPKLVLQDGVSNIRICIGIYKTEEEAESFAKSINSKFWVLK